MDESMSGLFRKGRRSKIPPKNGQIVKYNHLSQYEKENLLTERRHEGVFPGTEVEKEHSQLN